MVRRKRLDVVTVRQSRSNHNVFQIYGSNNTIKGLYITGGFYGIYMFGSHNNLIEGNIISGNATVGISIQRSESYNNIIIGNHIGVDETGTQPVSNSRGIVIAQGSHGNRIGGPTPAERNIISGNTDNGITIWGGSDNLVIGNYIGTDVNGINPIPNGGYGITVSSGKNVRIGGVTAAERNIISGNKLYGIQIYDSDSVYPGAVIGNFIGTDVSGTSAVPNGGGVRLWGTVDGTILGGTSAGERNLISGNDSIGVYLNGSGYHVVGNYIGTDITGSLPLGNSGDGIFATIAVRNNLVGGNSPAAGNIIAFNGGHGVNIKSLSPNHISLYNTIRLNSIHDNGGSGIAFAQYFPPEAQAPTLTEATTVLVSGTTVAKGIVDVYIADGDASGKGEGQTYVGSDISDANGNFVVAVSGVSPGDLITATVTDTLGTTSEFAENYVADLPSRSHVSITIFNLLGRKVANLLDEELASGSYRVNWDGVLSSGQHASSGVYFYRLVAADFIDTKKMLLLK